jgi:hypothetical protein
MSEQYELQETTVGALVAEELEAEAKSDAAKLQHTGRDSPQTAPFRAHETKVIHIWRPPTKKG